MIISITINLIEFRCAELLLSAGEGGGRAAFANGMRELLLNNVRVSRRGSWLSFRGPARVVSVLLSAPVTYIGRTIFERCFMAFCLMWSLILTGVFQVTVICLFNRRYLLINDWTFVHPIYEPSNKPSRDPSTTSTRCQNPMPTLTLWQI